MTGAEIILSTLVLLSNLFWAYQCHRLVNKVMSRDYAEYHALNNPPAPMKPFAGNIPLTDTREDLRSLEGFGVG